MSNEAVRTVNDIAWLIVGLVMLGVSAMAVILAIYLLVRSFR